MLVLTLVMLNDADDSLNWFKSTYPPTSCQWVIWALVVSLSRRQSQGVAEFYPFGDEPLHRGPRSSLRLFVRRVAENGFRGKLTG